MLVNLRCLGDGMQLGCPQCYGDDAEATATFFNTGGLATERKLVDDSHFVVSLRRCTDCGQAFVSIFTEFVDWSGGEDAQYRDVVPVTPAEAETVRDQGEHVDLQFLGSLGEGRRRLSSDWPTGAGKRVGWRTGTFRVQEGY
jgi:hypothetical protein